LRVASTVEKRAALSVSERDALKAASSEEKLVEMLVDPKVVRLVDLMDAKKAVELVF